MRRATLSRLFRGLALVALATTRMAAQAESPAVTKAALTIRPADVQRHINVIADDSMLGRDTPSRGLDLTAQYVADQFRKAGLKPAGESGTYFQRYAIQRKALDAPASVVKFEANGVSADAEFSADARWFRGDVPAQSLKGEPVFVGAPPADKGLKPDAGQLRGKIVGVVADFSSPSSAANVNRTLQALYAVEPSAILIISNRDSAAFALLVRAQSQARLSIGASRNPPVIEVAERHLGRALNIDLQLFRTNPTYEGKVIPGLTVTIAAKETILSEATAPNVVAVLEGTDPVLRNEYVVYSAHMDHIGVRPGQPDSINNGADDDASGTVGLIELAGAYGQAGAAPRRSIIFLGVSGEEKGLWGSQYFSEHPTVPIGSIAADINIDMIGRNWKDSIVAIGKEHSDLGATLARVNGAHPELHMTAIDDIWPEERFYFRSDHYNFARKGVPILFFFNGVHADYHKVSDSPDKIDAEKESRILKLVFFLGESVANRRERPVWNPESYKQIVQGPGGR